MGWMDDLKMRAEQAFDDAKGGLQDYLAKSGAEAVVKIAAPRTGNLSAAQIAAGQRGAPPAMQPPVQVAKPVAMQAAAISKPILLAIGVGAYFLLQRRRG